MSMLRKLAAVILTLALCLSLCVPALAEGYEPTEAEYAAIRENAGEFGGVEYAPPEDVSVPLPELPEAGTYAEGQLLVKLRRPSGVRAMAVGGGIFDGLAASVSTIFSVEVTGEGAPGDSHGSSDGSSDGLIPAKADWVRVELAEGVDMLSAWRQLLDEDTVLCVEPNYIRQACGSIEDVTAFDPFIHSQTWLEAINAPAAWDALGEETPGNGVVVAVVDTGVDLDHPDLKGNLLNGYDFVDNDITADDESGHGTHVAGIIAALRNGAGVRGVACGAKILPVRVLGAGGGTDDNIAKGILYAAGVTVSNSNGQAVSPPSQKADIINMSLGGFGYSSFEQDAILQARKQGCLVVAAAGNDSLPTAAAGDEYYGPGVSPGGLTGVLTVMAMDVSADENGDWLAGFSNYDADPGAGDEYEIMAPGVDILSTYRGGGYGYMNGTSMACPVAAGAAAVLMGMGRTADEAWAILADSSEKQGRTQPNGTVRSYPALDLAAAVEKAKAEGTYTTAPELINCGVYAASDLTAVTLREGGAAVNLSDLFSISRLFFKGSEPLSGLVVGFENIGGRGIVSVSGTVGGVAVSGATAEAVPIGGSGSISLALSAMPTVSADGGVTASLTLSCGGTTASVERTFTAYDLTVPEDVTYSATNARYELSADSVSVVNNSTSGIRKILCLDAELYIAPGKSLDINNSIVYQAQSSGIALGFASAETGGYGILAVYNSYLRGGVDFYINSNGYLFLGGCTIYDPYIITGAGRVESCSLINSGRAANTALNCYEVMWSGFYYLNNFALTSTHLTGCMINRCTNATFSVAERADANTFVENFGSTPESVLKFYTQDYSKTEDSSKGFGFNNVIGPMSVYLTGTTTTAKLGPVYYQSVNGAGTGERLTPTGVEDAIVCAAESSVSNDPGFPTESGFAAASPAFVTGVTGGYSYNSAYGAVCYTITYAFSTAVQPGCNLWPGSSTNRFVDGAKAVLSEDGRTCTVTVMSPVDFDTLKATEYYDLSGYYTATRTVSGNRYFYGYTPMGYQSAKKFPVSYVLYSSALETVSLSPSGGQPVLTWSDSRYTDAIPATVYRSMDGGAYEKISGDTTVSSPYTDRAALAPGHVYDYKVEAVNSGRTFTGYATYVYSLADNDMGADFTAGDMFAPSNEVPVKLLGAWLVDGSATFTIPAPALKINRIEFADQVKNSGASYGAKKNDDGSVTITIGCNDNVSLMSGNLFKLFVDTSEGGKLEFNVVNGGMARQWGTSDSCVYAVIPTVGTVAVDDQHAVCYATYKGSRMTAVHDIEAGTFDFAAKLGDNDTLKVFFLNPDGSPLRECAAYPAA